MVDLELLKTMQDFMSKSKQEQRRALTLAFLLVVPSVVAALFKS